MTFRTKLLVISTLTVAGAVAVVTGGVAIGIRNTFDAMDNNRREAVISKFTAELAARGKEVADAVQRSASSDSVLRLAFEANRPDPDYSAYVAEAQQVAQLHGLDFLDLAGPQGRIISSAHYVARFGYPHDWTVADSACETGASFLARVPAQEGPVLALASCRSVAAGGGKPVLVLGATRLNEKLLAGLEGAPGLRVFLWRAPGDILTAAGPLTDARPLEPLISYVQKSLGQTTQTVSWSSAREDSESVLAFPLQTDGKLMAILLLANSLRDRVRLERSILSIGLSVGLSGILLGVLIGWWTAARVSRPIAQLVEGVRGVASGDLSARVEIAANDEIGELAAAFNHMTGQLLAQRERTVQAERVAAWRELARRLAHEMKNPLFPLQLTVENLRKAHEVNAANFDEILRESTGALLAELANLKTITARFSDFAKMPAPRFEPVELNTIVREAARLHSHALPVAVEAATAEIHLQADPEQLRRLLTNLILNARDAMPEGGEVRITTEASPHSARITVSDTGTGLTPEECERLFTPYYTTKQHGTGLGLAIVQSVVSDHGGRISVASTPGKGATFTIDLPIRRDS